MKHLRATYLKSAFPVTYIDVGLTLKTHCHLLARFLAIPYSSQATSRSSLAPTYVGPLVVMLHKLSLIKKFGSLLVFIYCLLLLEFSVPITFFKRSTLNDFVIHDISFVNYSLHYKYIMMPELSLCDGSRGHNPLVVATVLSTANRTDTRRAIRESWASSRESHSVKTGKILVFFMISAPASMHDLYMLQKEQKKHRDLIVTDLVESYENLVFKVYASIVFHQQYCPKAQFLMKVDDDVGVHLDRMVKLWKIDERANKSMYCQVWPRSRPKRDPSNKWFMSDDEWPDQYYPHYCNGPMYVMGKIAGQNILDQAQIFPPLAIEDVFYTGVVAESADVRRVNWGRSMLSNTKV
ncbi:hypothetical protein Y032_0307g2040 [Ancylostoma ceylanicum]|uniref:Hexosyltransferase n=1 Tax=Ancylostoma ceylanicum TaxID=53326 RepID=A0A016S3X9_9BILA|nr:hypothetical protein Y032_0307g2040 [Ancylostoma ceylanicum]